jgi:hypothetical protein
MLSEIEIDQGFHEALHNKEKGNWNYWSKENHESHFAFQSFSYEVEQNSE